jgi:hypothetical protein
MLRSLLSNLSRSVARSAVSRTRFVRPFSADTSIAGEDVYYSRVFVNKPAPQFKAQALVDDQFKQVSLSDYKGYSNLLLFIYLFFVPFFN